MSTPKQAAEIWVKQKYGKASTRGLEYVKTAFLAGASHSDAELTALREKLARAEAKIEEMKELHPGGVRQRMRIIQAKHEVEAQLAERDARIAEAVTKLREWEYSDDGYAIVKLIQRNITQLADRLEGKGVER